MPDNNWDIALRTFYESDDGQIRKRSDDGVYSLGRDCILVEKIGDLEEARKTVAFLGRANLITSSDDADNNPTLELTKEGFQVAHDLNKNERQSILSGLVAGFTFVIALTSITATLPQISDFPLTSAVAYSLLILTIFGILIAMFFWPRKFARTLW